LFFFTFAEAASSVLILVLSVPLTFSNLLLIRCSRIA